MSSFGGDFGLSSTISTWGNVLTDYYGTKYDKQESELAYKRAIENRDYMNQYNSPKAQMERLRAAGLNPNLMYGQGTMGQQTQSPSYEPVKSNKSYKRVDPIDIAAIAQAKKTTAEAEGIEIENKFKNESLGDRIAQEKWNYWTKLGQASKGMTMHNFQEKHRQELVDIMYKTAKNEMDKSDFDAWLSRQKMSKSDTLVARKLFEVSDEVGLDGLMKKGLKKIGDYINY